jgi:hypothetical protein
MDGGCPSHSLKSHITSVFLLSQFCTINGWSAMSMPPLISHAIPLILLKYSALIYSHTVADWLPVLQLQVNQVDQL